MRWLLVALLSILVMLQYRLWIAEGSVAELHRLRQQAADQVELNAELTTRNAVLEREVLELQGGNKGVEQRAREQLGLIRKGETFYQFVEKWATDSAAATSTPPPAEPDGSATMPSPTGETPQ